MDQRVVTVGERGDTVDVGVVGGVVREGRFAQVFILLGAKVGDQLGQIIRSLNLHGQLKLLWVIDHLWPRKVLSCELAHRS